MKVRKPTLAGAALAAVVLAASLALVPAAFASKGSKPTGGGSSTISAPVMVVDNNGDGLPNWNDTVTFNVSTTATTQPYVNLQCFQNGVLVANGSAGFFASALNSGYDFTLNSGAWTGGAADCTAYLGMYTKRGWKQLASTSFHASA